MWWLAALPLSTLQPAPPACVADGPCELELRFSSRAVEALLGGADRAWWIAGDALTVVARREGETSLCCAMQPHLRPIGAGLQAVSVRIPDIDTAMFDIRLMPEQWSDSAPLWRGRSAPPPPPEVDELAGAITDHGIDSVHLGSRRTVTVYLPPGVSEGERLPVLYLADGMHPEFVRILEAAILGGSVRPTIVVAFFTPADTRDPSCAPRCDARSQEYLIDIPGASPEELRFDAHARFIAEEVIPLIEARYPTSTRAEQRATAGYSSGGAWAVTMAARHPDLFGNALGLSIGWLPAAEAAGNLRGRVYLGAGRLEPGRFRDRTSLAAERARSGSAEVRHVELNGGHSFDMWKVMFADALAWLFPGQRSAE